MDKSQNPPPHTVQYSHLLILRKKAMDLGASDARVIPADMICIEEEIIEMCRANRCEGYGKSANCPPHVIGPKQAREWVREYPKALLFKIDVSPELLLREERFTIFKKVCMIVSELEALSKKQGYALSKGLAAGSCKPVFCKHIACEALINGGKCRYPSLARPSMEALGINVFKLARDVGWDIYPILKDSDPKAVPNAMLAGLLLVA